MTCPECKSEETIVDSGELFCKKCGLELNEFITTTKGKSFAQNLNVQRLNFKIDPKQELFALKLGLKNNQLKEGWQKYLGFSLKENNLRPELKEKAFFMITKAFELHKEKLEAQKSLIKKNWNLVSAKYLIELENLMQFPIENDFDCYLSLITRYGFHNSSKNFIILNFDLGLKTNYVIAHELFNLQFRKYINRFFKEGYDKIDEEISKILVAFVLLYHPKIKECFPEIKFTMDMFHPDKYKLLAEKIQPLWDNRSSFKELMVLIYGRLGITKKWVSY